MTPFIAELLGTAFIIAFGNGVVANVVLHKTKGHNGGLIAITFGWSMAVFMAVYIAGAASGAHLNSAVTIGLASLGKFDWALVPQYLLAQLLGAMLGQLIVFMIYKDHFNATAAGLTQRACFCTDPAIRNPIQNFMTEFLATFIFMLAVLFITKASSSLGSLDALPVALVVLAIGLSFGGPTGYAINPARDLGPRIMHFILPMTNKSSSDWRYAWVPIVGPILGAVAAGFIYTSLL
ncbi:MIP/aquaporin family protein [Sediminibacterium sp.]|uniref:MIP/aquaporin family protein n=1 Tax=Sediminibacterium sp. TaxID=1917865 RepID=UPI00273711E1|nr:MIP/aquaporin family protein [Sediminibacterium sp.]MDP3392457.1 MIP/aquaporin family protein [Sediminibacterium sp.]MDP3565723.1 MIP/aquaporin family protein [Sediminibacterium sp.]